MRRLVKGIVSQPFVFVKVSVVWDLIAIKLFAYDLS